MAGAEERDRASEAIWAAMLDVYAGALAGDRQRADRHLDPDCTFWDSHAMPLVRGLGQLQRVRDARPAADGDGAPTDVEAVRLEVRFWGDLALLLHAFRLTDDAGSVLFTARNSSVWRWHPDRSRWTMAHNHEDVVAGQYWPG